MFSALTISTREKKVLSVRLERKPMLRRNMLGFSSAYCVSADAGGFAGEAAAEAFAAFRRRMALLTEWGVEALA